MKKIIFILLTIILVIIIFYISLYVFINLKGKSLFLKFLKENFNREAEISSFKFRFPFIFTIENFKSKDFNFKKSDIYLGYFNPFILRLVLKRVYIDGLKLTIKKEREGLYTSFLGKEITYKKEILKEEPKVGIQRENLKKIKKREFSLKIKKFYFENAMIDFLDNTLSPPLSFNLSNINLYIDGFEYPNLQKFNLKFSSNFKKDNLIIKDFIKADGWIDYLNKDMDLKLNINNFDYLVFSEYYPPFWRPTNLGVKNAILSLKANFNSINNDLLIDAILYLDKIEFLDKVEDETNLKFLKTVIEIFKGEEEKPSLPIRLKTKMDDFSLDLSSLQSEIKGKIKIDKGTMIFNILSKSINKTKDTIKEGAGIVIDKTGVIIDKTSKVVKDTIETIVEAIKVPVEKKEESKESSP